MNSVHLSISQDLFDALIAHFWKARAENVPRELAFFPQGYLISYSDLVKSAKVEVNPRNVGAYLNDVAAHCKKHFGDAPLHALVVSKERMVPGQGYYAAPLSSGDEIGWMTIDAPKCIAFDDFPTTAPMLDI